VTTDGAFVWAWAKVNLVLRVGPRRADGYHEVLSLMARCGAADVLTIAPAPRTVVRCAALPGGDTLVTRALHELCAAAGHQGGFRVRIDKRIPAGAGLGGGSSDAAAALQTATRLLPHPVDDARLLTIAARVGSDVPFFLGPPVAIARGRGDRIEPGPDLPRCELLLAYPGRPLATRDVYEAFTPTASLPDALPVPRTVEELAALVRNDLAGAAERLEPRCRTLREGMLAAGALAASVTGSGSAVFGLFADAETADGALDRLPDAVWTARATLGAE
jgi:4-diphosphocytidyl-2-C-methyl-D-erythritol kinase